MLARISGPSQSPLTGLTRLIPVNLEFSEPHVSTQTHAQRGAVMSSAQRCGIICTRLKDVAPVITHTIPLLIFYTVKVIRMLSFLERHTLLGLYSPWCRWVEYAILSLLTAVQKAIHPT